MNKLIAILEANKDKTVEEVLPLIQSIICATNTKPSEQKQYDRAPIPIGVNETLAPKMNLKRWDELNANLKGRAIRTIDPINELAFIDLVKGNDSIYWFDKDYNIYVH